MSLEGVEEEEQGEDPEGEGTGSTELSDIRLLGRCERVRYRFIFLTIIYYLIDQYQV